jgi:circadian clock protein KaiC
MDRIKTGIKGLDNLIEGGIPKGSFVVVTGRPGTGKTILGSQFLANGVTKFKEKGLFISVEQSREEIISQANQFNWDLERMEKEGKLKIITLNAQKLFEMKKVEELEELIKKDHYTRVVIDSITSFVYSSISPSSIAIGADKKLMN